MSPQLSTPFLNFVRWGCDVSGDSSIFSPSELISGATAVEMSSGPAAEWVSSVAVAAAVTVERSPSAGSGSKALDGVTSALCCSGRSLDGASCSAAVLARLKLRNGHEARASVSCELRVLLCELDPQKT